jgi:hypothetical protein
MSEGFLSKRGVCVFIFNRQPLILTHRWPHRQGSSYLPYLQRSGRSHMPQGVCICQWSHEHCDRPSHTPVPPPRSPSPHRPNEQQTPPSMGRQSRPQPILTINQPPNSWSCSPPKIIPGWNDTPLLSNTGVIHMNFKIFRLDMWATYYLYKFNVLMRLPTTQSSKTKSAKLGKMDC